MLAVITVVVVVGATARSAGATAGEAPELGSVPLSDAVAQDAPDPEVVVAGGLWFLLSTNTVVGGVPANLPVWLSRDRAATWHYVGDALPALGSWAQEGWTWSPAVDRRPGGAHVLYYTARDRASGVQCIGVATAGAPAGPYVDDRDRPLVCQGELGGSIDADVFTAGDGIRHLTWKSDANNPAVAEAPVLWSQPLDASGRELTGRAAPLLAGGTGPEGVVEGPSLFVLPDGLVGLLYSAGWWESADYHMRLARCPAPAGPCTTTPWGPPLARAGGGGSVFTADGGVRHVAYHRWVGPPSYAEGGVRVVVVAALDPVLPPAAPTRPPASGGAGPAGA